MVPKYRRKVITGKVEGRLKDIIASVASENKWEIMLLETMPNHVHLFIQTGSLVAPNNIIARIKGVTSRLLREEFTDLKRRLATLWTRGYFVSAHGHISSETIMKYVEDQKKE